MKTIIKNAYIVNEGKTFIGSVILENGFIKEIFKGKQENTKNDNAEVIDAEGKYLLPGVIDDQVHFREPGLTHKADLFSESKAAVAGGVTSFMEMPNTIPNAITIDLLEEKYQLAAEKSLANFSFYLGASNDNLDELKKLNPINNCGIKVFMGSSTGNMLVNDPNILQQIFSTNHLIAVHCEDDRIIKENLEKQKEIYGENIPFSAHSIIRNAEACYRSSSMAVAMALKMNTRLHLLHLSSAEEMNLLENTFPLEKKKITAEVCVHHLWFSDKDYEEKGTFIKWNPAIKSENDCNALWQALLDDRLDVIATDHAPHTLEEKTKGYLSAPSGGPLIQHSLIAMLEFYHQQKISIETIVHKMAHAPAICFHISKRGFIRPGFHADLVLVDINNPWKVDRSNILSKCKWSPFEGTTFHSQVTHTFVNGNLVYCNGLFTEHIKGKRILFEHD